jgi:hypothetical protein
MGYILPVQHDGYQQYVNRSLAVVGRYSHIRPTTATQLSNTYHNEEKKQTHQRFADVLEQKMKTVKMNKDITISTENGKLFNELI